MLGYRLRRKIQVVIMAPRIEKELEINWILRKTALMHFLLKKLYRPSYEELYFMGKLNNSQDFL